VAFRAAIPTETKRFIGVRIRSTQDLRLVRPQADVPVLRGTAVTMSRREGYLWITGYIPRLRTYPGFETPKPILIEINRGEGDLNDVMRDVLALTKVKYNSCDYVSGLPVTLKFAERVGEILLASPRGTRGAAVAVPLLHLTSSGVLCHSCECRRDSRSPQGTRLLITGHPVQRTVDRQLCKALSKPDSRGKCPHSSFSQTSGERLRWALARRRGHKRPSGLMTALDPGCVNVWPAPSARVLVSSVDQSTPTYPVSGRTLAKMEIRTSWSS